MTIAPQIPSQDRLETSPPPRSKRGDWTWELVTLFPQQGDWTEREYLSREFDGLVEYSDGVLEFLPMPGWLHQLIVDYLHSHLKQFVQPRSLGLTAFAPLRVRIGERRYREPDVLFVKPDRFRGLDQPSEGADLVMEVVSETQEDRDRDLIEKPVDYAAAGIPEYWIVDPQSQTITVLVLEKKAYRVHGVFKIGSQATSLLLPGFQVDVSAAFAAAKPFSN